MKWSIQEAANWYCKEYLRVDRNNFSQQREYTIENYVKFLERQVYYEKESILNSPAKIEWHITNYCDQKCYFCYSGMCGKQSVRDELSISELEQLLTSMQQENVIEIQIEGGEPLLYPHIEYVLKTLKQNRHRIRLLTNGTSFTRSIMHTIKDHFTKYDVLQISIHGHNSQLHNRIVGRTGSFALLTHNLDLLQSMDIPVRISTVVTKENIAHLTDIYKFIKQFSNVKVFVAQPTIPIGDASVDDTVSNEQLLLAYYDIYMIRESHDPKLALLMGHCFDIPEIKDYIINYGERDNIQYCSAGRSRLSIEANGDVYPCHFLKHEEFLIGNIKKQSIGEIWNNSPQLNKVRLGRDKDSYCNNCEMKVHCVKKGICTSYAKNKNINDKPINCFMV